MSIAHKTFRLSLPTRAYFKLLSTSRSSREAFVRSIISTGFDNCFLEFPPFNSTDNQTGVNGEFTVTQSRPFSKANWRTFDEHLSPAIKKTPSQLVASFNNLSGDTVLITPVPLMKPEHDSHSGHLMDFLKNGDKEQIDALIKCIALNALLITEKSTSNLYVSTHGHGVPWLHVRLSPTPKYYTHTAYATKR
ncbi:hypothetical protein YASMINEVIRUS_326 [Yasminevirus sp. GU-2018]|uniref:Uncharacterized protein n=1 Tax=Yasminevirus sp. GU-2018 TaxID=2420051 RepID=A0A5K0U946_9VIRU|nr:hypothetical protein YASMINEVIRUS_326 [Yasminevirus sp. GU-2018]